MTGSGVAATKAAQASRQAFRYSNEARMSGNSSISGYSSYAGSYTGYYNSSYETGKVPSIDAPRIKDVDEEQVKYCDLATATSAVSSLASFSYGLTKTINAALSDTEASYLVAEANNWVRNGYVDVPVIPHLQEAAIQRSLARRATALSGLATGIGTVIDLAVQLATNESVSIAVTKAGSHLLLGLASGAAVAALTPVVPAVAILAGITINYVAAGYIDSGIDYINQNTSFFEGIDNKLYEWSTELTSLFRKKD